MFIALVKNPLGRSAGLGATAARTGHTSAKASPLTLRGLIRSPAPSRRSGVVIGGQEGVGSDSRLPTPASGGCQLVPKGAERLYRRVRLPVRIIIEKGAANNSPPVPWI